jgi:hypothetical protein
MSLIAVLSSPSITMSVNAGIQMRSTPLGATKPLAIATAFTAWFKAPAPIACSSAQPFSLKTPAKAPATEFGLDFADTFNTSTDPTSPIEFPSNEYIYAIIFLMIAPMEIYCKVNF